MSPRDWVGERLGVNLAAVSSTVGLSADDLVGLGLRRNPKRAHLLVSLVLGKHVPTDPRVVYGSGVLLGCLARQALENPASPVESTPGDRPACGQLTQAAAALRAAVAHPADGQRARHFGTLASALVGPELDEPPVVVGYAETAVSLGHAVADALPGSTYLHSTRRLTGVPPVGGFEEEHSHATGHLLCPADPSLLTGPTAASRPLVLVDDELTTGRTILNTIAALHRLAARPHYVVATLLDLRSADDERAMAQVARQLGVRLDVVCLARGRTQLPDGLAKAAAALVSEFSPRPAADQGVTAVTGQGESTVQPGRSVHVRGAGFPESGRHGITSEQRARLTTWLATAARELAPKPGERVLVLGFEEFMAAPLLVARAWADAEPAAIVRFSTTTRSPALALDSIDYPLRTALTLASGETLPPDDAGVRFAYNVAPPQDAPAWDRIVACFDDQTFAASGQARTALLSQLVVCADQVDLMEVPTFVPLTAALPDVLRGPGFGSYSAEEVGWLLKDLSDVPLEAPTANREREIQSGRAHYAESLPIEYQPDAAYTALFHQAVVESASRLAHDTGVVAELVRAERGPRPVLVSLARAGVPVGILIRRWFAQQHGWAPPHYAVSIVRGRGIDANALAWLRAHHDPADVVFVDGWTGKGAITRELTAAIDDYNDRHGTAFNPDLVVLADPGRCVRTFGTRDDFLIPSACLNSTVSGLVSRTVLNAELIGAHDFHGAKFYAELAGADVSNRFLDAVSARFETVVADVDRDWPVLARSAREPDWAGWAAVQAISDRYGIGQVNLVKPGVGETTRVLLRRVPERVLIRPDSGADLAHVLQLARERGVPVDEVPGLAYSCVGLIRPQEGGEG